MRWRCRPALASPSCKHLLHQAADICITLVYERSYFLDKHQHFEATSTYSWLTKDCINWDINHPVSTTNMSTTWPYSFIYNLYKAPRPSSSSRCAIAQNRLTAESTSFYSTDFQHPAKTTPTWYSNCDSAYTLHVQFAQWKLILNSSFHLCHLSCPLSIHHTHFHHTLHPFLSSVASSRSSKLHRMSTYSRYKLLLVSQHWLNHV